MIDQFLSVSVFKSNNHCSFPFLVAKSTPCRIGGISVLVGAVLNLFTVLVPDNQTGCSIGFVGDGSGATVFFVICFHV
jgi:hypothetical protein